MPRKKKDPYANYDLDDWQWEFLRRNKRYQQAYKAVEWLKKRLEKKAASPSGGGKCFVAFGTSYWFSPVYVSDHIVWSYVEKWFGDEGSMELGWYVDTHGQSPWHFKTQASLDLNPGVAAIGRRR